MATLLSANSAEDLQRELSRIDLTVSPRSMGRTTAQTESFSIAHLLSSLPAKDLRFPLTLEHRDRPDFVLVSHGTSIGIELTEAVAENLARSSALREQGVGPSTYLLRRATPGEPARSSATLKQEILQDIPGRPWEGDEPEREWAAAMAHFAASKVAKAAKPGFARYEQNWLLIYDNWSLPAVDLEHASGLLLAELLAANISSTFDRVFVLGSKCLCEFGALAQVHKVREPSVGS